MDIRERVRLITDPAFTPEDTQPLSFGGAWHPASTLLPDRAAVFDADELRQIGSQAAREGCTPRAARIDAAGHTVCDLTRDDLRELSGLLSCERASLLSERRMYVKARNGDLGRFNELLATIDARLNTVTKLSDKVARLFVVAS